MADNKDLPGDHGQFGVDNATEAFKPLQDAPKPAPNTEASDAQTGPRPPDPKP